MLMNINTSEDLLQRFIVTYRVAKKYKHFDNFYDESPAYEQMMLVTGQSTNGEYKTSEALKSGNVRLYRIMKQEYYDLVLRKILFVNCDLNLLKNMEKSGKLIVLEENRCNVNVHKIRLLEVRYVRRNKN